MMHPSPNGLSWTNGRDAVGLGLFVVLSSCGSTHPFGSDLEPAEWGAQTRREVELALELVEGERLELHALRGAVHVEVSSGTPELIAELWSQGVDAATAEAALDAAQLRLTPGVAGKTASLADPNPLGAELAELRLGFRAKLPAGTELFVRGAAGSAVVIGAVASVDVALELGDISLEGVRGAISASTGAGRLRLQESVCTDVELSCNSGDLQIHALTAEKVRVSMGAGPVLVEGLTAKGTLIEVNHGDVLLGELEGPLDVRVGTGSVDLRGGGPAERKIDATFGPVRVREAMGSLLAEVTYGPLRVLQFEGDLVANSGFGAVEATGVFSSLSAHSGSGPLRVQALSGSAPTGPWELKSDHGDVIVQLPAGFGCRLNARTVDGVVHSDFPVLLEAGVVDGGRTLRGIVDQGGEPLLLSTTSGNVRIERLAPSQDRH